MISPHLTAQFSPTGVFLNSATFGLAPTCAREEMTGFEGARSAGTLDSTSVDDVIDSCRSLLATMFGTHPDLVAVSASASQFIGVIAASLPAGAVVLCAEGDFTSVLFPFLARADIETRVVALDQVADAVTDDVDLVAVSAVQSACGTVLPLEDLAERAEAAGARLMLDVTQAAGWLPLAGVRADFIVGGGYKWLLGPRGTSYLTGSAEAMDTLRPLAANWYGGEDRWSSIYGTPLRLSSTARRLDLSPAWGCWVGLEPTLRLLLEAGIDKIHAHNVGLANRFTTGLGLPPADSAIVSIALPDGAAERLSEAGVVTATRAGKARCSFHLYNTEADVDTALAAVTA